MKSDFPTPPRSNVQKVDRRTVFNTYQIIHSGMSKREMTGDDACEDHVIRSRSSPWDNHSHLGDGIHHQKNQLLTLYNDSTNLIFLSGSFCYRNYMHCIKTANNSALAMVKVVVFLVVQSPLPLDYIPFTDRSPVHRSWTTKPS